MTSSFSLWEVLQNEGDELDVNDEAAMLSASTGSLNNSDLYSGDEGEVLNKHE